MTLRTQRNIALLFLGCTLLAWPRAGQHPQAHDAVARAATLEQRVLALEKKLQYLTVNVDKAGYPWMRITGANVLLTNGMGRTATTNGTGNLIVGYNEMRREGDARRLRIPFEPVPNVRTGSHNLIVGTTHSYASYGGLVAGEWNTLSSPHASITGGFGNHVRGHNTTVSGGQQNIASGHGAVVSGGSFNGAVGYGATVCGGDGNAAFGDYATVTGGRFRTADDAYDWVAGSLREDQ